MKPKSLTIRMRLILAIGVFFVIMLVMFFAFLHPMIRRNILNSEEEKIRIYATSVAAELNKDLQEAIMNLESIASLDAIRSLERERIDPVLSNLDATTQSFIFYQVINASGFVVSRPSKPERVGADRSEFEFFQGTLSENRTHICHLRISPSLHYSLNIGTPIRNDEGKIIGVLVGSMGLADRNPQAYHSILEPTIPEGWQVLLISEKGFLIAHSHQVIEGTELRKLDFSSHPSVKNAFQKKWGFQTFEFMEQRWCANSARIRLTGWTVVVQAPEMLVIKHVDDVANPIAIFAGTFLIILLGTGLLAAGRFIGPLELLTTSLKRYGERGEVELVEAKGSDEIATALHAFNEMVVDRKKAEEALRKSEERLRSLVETTNDWIWEVDQNGIYTYASPAVKDMLGYETDEVIGKTPFDLMVPDEAERIARFFEDAVKYRKPIAMLENTNLHKDGRHVVLETSGVPIIDEAENLTGYRGIDRDITERKQAEEEKKALEAKLQQAQKMESIGTLAGGIAHDFNNLLMGILGHASLLMLHIDSDHPHFERLKGIQDMVQTGADLTKQLLGFARGGKYEIKPTDLNELIKQSCEMFGRTQKNIEINRKHQKDIWPVEVDRGQIHQVLLNLYVNAWHAMSGGGYIYIETSNVMLDENDTKPFNVKPGKYVKISVTDTGAGMDKTTQQKIFDPFFTTKEMSRGTGLGLASAYGIIKNHIGIINVYSEKGKGATFNIYLPASEKEVSITKKSGTDEIPKGTETVLLVDDEEIILDVGKDMLTEMGYKVLLAGSGKEAVETYKKHKGDIELVIVDMIMPRMEGGEVYDKIKEINSEVKVLLSSGYSIDREAKEILARGCDAFIQKPFGMKELSRKIRGVLNKR